MHGVVLSGGGATLCVVIPPNKHFWVVFIVFLQLRGVLLAVITGRGACDGIISFQRI